MSAASQKLHYVSTAKPNRWLLCIGIFIHQWLYSPLFSPGLFFSSVIFSTQTVGLLRRVISPSQDRYLHTGQHKHRINAHANIDDLSGIRTHDPSVWASEDSSCLRPCGHRDRRCMGKHSLFYSENNLKTDVYTLKTKCKDF
jgi:hypothetical protein